MKAIVVGGGGFGKWHGKNLIAMPEVTSLVVTRQTLDGVEQTREFLHPFYESKRSANPNFKLDIAVVQNISDLERQLERNDTDLVTVATPPGTHREFAIAAYEHSRTVLVEKPYTGASFVPAGAEQAILTGHSEAIGIHLPMHQTGLDLRKSEHFAPICARGELNIQLYWGTANPRGNALEDLAVHPWTLLAPALEVRPVDVSDRGKSAEMSAELYEGARYVGMAHIELSSEKRRIRIAVNGLDYRLEMGGVRNTLKDPNGETISSVDNPLRSHLAAALASKPLADGKVAYASQKFLHSAFVRSL